MSDKYTDYPRFHCAFPINDLQKTRDFYVNVLGCRVGRSAEKWIDFDFFGHQISAHVCNSKELLEPTNIVDGKNVPVRHFGLILDWDLWHNLKDKFLAAGLKFIIDPYIRFKGEVGEQATMFFLDPSGNAIELKSFRDQSQLFAA